MGVIGELLKVNDKTTYVIIWLLILGQAMFSPILSYDFSYWKSITILGR